MNEPLVTVAMAAYNSELYIKESIESILTQSYNNFELIIVNDGSTDRTKEIVLTFKDPRIKLIDNITNLGIVKTRNICIEKSSGKYLAIFDSDDIALPDRLKLQVSFLEKNNDYCLCGTDYQIIDSKGKPSFVMIVPKTDQDIKTYLHFNIPFCHSTMLFRKSYLKEYSYLPGFEQAEDYELTLRLSKLSKMASLNSKTVLYRVHGNNITLKNKSKIYNFKKQLAIKILNDIKIPYSEKELELHINFFDFNFQFFSDEQKWKDLSDWLIKFYQFIKASSQMNKSMVARMIILRWFFVATKNKKYKRILFSPISAYFKIKYFTTVLIFFYNKILNKYVVY